MKKKYLFLSLIAAMVMALGAKAQEEAYNMIIKMADGTTVFINPHDVDSISFNNGEVSVSGSNIDELVQMMQENRERTEMLETNMADSRLRTAVLEDHMYRVQGEVDYNSMMIKGDAQIINPETGEPYTVVVEPAWDEYDEENDDWIYHEAKTGPLTMALIAEHMVADWPSYWEGRVKDLEYRIEGLYRPLQEFLGCDYWDTWYTGEKLVEFLDVLKHRLDALDGGADE